MNPHHARLYTSNSISPGDALHAAFFNATVNNLPTLSILTRSLLARLQLLQIPAANLHVSLVLVHAVCEVLRIHLASWIAVLGAVCLLVGACGVHLLLVWLSFLG